MNPMAVPHPSQAKPPVDIPPIPHPQDTSGRRYGAYSSQVPHPEAQRAESADSVPRMHSGRPQMAQRWDSLPSKGPRSPTSPTYSSHPYGPAGYQSPRDAPPHHYQPSQRYVQPRRPPPTPNQYAQPQQPRHYPPHAGHQPRPQRSQTLPRAPPPHGPSPSGVHLQDGAGPAYDMPGDPNTRPLHSKNSMPDMRLQDNYANFSRPRKQSLRQAAPDPLTLMPQDNDYLPPRPADMQDYSNTSSPQTPPWQPSSETSSIMSPSIISSPASSNFYPHPHSAVDYPDPRQAKRLPNHGSYPAPMRPTNAFSRLDSSGSLPSSSGAPVMASTSAPWLGGDEPRASFRSQLTSSTAPGTSATERSSILTKGSTVPSVYATPEEPSLDDLMGMYEEGFGDEEKQVDNSYTVNVDTADEGDDESNYGDADESRPPTAMFELPKPKAESDSKPDGASGTSSTLRPPTFRNNSNLDAEIRQSRMIFSSPAFIASLSHINSTLDDPDQNDDKRDSAKSIDSDPSATSDNALRNSNANSASLPDMASRSQTPTSPPTSTPSNTTSASTAPTSINTTPSNAVMPAEQEPPGFRDRYGFKKENQYITRRQYDSWDKGYSEYLDRRKKKWVGYLKENALITEKPKRFPPANAKTKRFVRKGIPPEWRGAAWFYYAGGPAILAKHGGLYFKLLHKRGRRVDIEAIERDLHRTFPDNIKFKPTGGSDKSTDEDNASSSDDEDDENAAPKIDDEPPIITSLRRVLYAFSIYNPHIGYCQSLNFIAGLLLLFVDTEEQVFWLLNVITHIYLPGTHELSLEGSKVDLSVLMAELRDTMPAVWDRIGGELEAEQPNQRPQTSKSLRKSKSSRSKLRPQKSQRLKNRGEDSLSSERLPPITLCMTAWFMSCFIGTLPIETTLRVWDVFFYEGSKTLFRIALAVFKLGENEILKVADPMEMFGVVQAMPRRMLDANMLMEACFKKRNGFGHLSQEVIEERRQRRRDASGGASGNVTEGEVEVKRKGTLFGRKKRDASRTRVD